MMTNTHAKSGRWIVGISLATCLAVTANVVRAQDDFLGSDRAEIRGQSPSGYGRLSPNLPSESTAMFRSTANPWIMASQELPAPAYGSSPPVIAQTLPTDPFGQPGMGQPLYGDPALGGLYLNQPAVWQPYVAAQGKAGNENAGAFGQLMMPLYQDGQSLFFADIRGRFDDSSNSEGNFGLALRTMVDPTWFVGIYGFYDYKRTEAGNHFSQGTLGIEAMSVMYEARLNGYIPESGAKTANSASTTEFEAGTIFVKGGLERAYYGVDGELGAMLWESWGGNLEFRGFVGGYWFDTDGANFPSVAGPKGRLEMRLYDLSCFGPESRLTLGVEVQNDSVRDFQVSGLARLEIPLGVFPGARKLTRLERRMLDRIVRDDDIITVTGQGPREVGIDSLTKRPLTNVSLVDATTVGGTPLATAVTNAGANSIVVVDGSKGAITTPGNVTPLAGQVLRGGGFQAIGSQTGASAVFGARPTITSTNNANNTILLNNNFVTVADLDLVQGFNGMFAANPRTGLLISGNSVTTAANHGFHFNSLNATSIVQNNVARTNGTQGFLWNGVFSGTANGNTATNNTQNGFGIETLAGTFQGNTATGNGRFGLGLDTLAATGVISGNVANQNVQGGIAIFDGVNGPQAGTVTENTANSNGRDATGTIIDASADGFRIDGPTSTIVSNNTASFNADRGFEFNGNLAAAGRVTGNSSIQNFGRGFHFNSTLDAGSIVSGNLARRNGFNIDGTANPAGIDGFAFTGAVSGMISDNISENNQQAGFFIESLQAAGSVINNTATNNPFGGFVFNTSVNGVVDKNFASGSNSTAAGEGYGFDFTAANLLAAARVTENTSSYNRIGYGFNATNAATVINGNTASFNGFNLGGGLFDATGNGFEWVVANSNALVTNNVALSNANNGFSGTADNAVNNAGTFQNNLSNTNGDKGYVVTNPTPNNLGSGNVNGNNTAP